MPYNVERLLLLASNLNTTQVSTIMKQFDSSKAVNIPNDLMELVSEMITGNIINSSSIRLINTTQGYTILKQFESSIAVHVPYDLMKLVCKRITG